MQYIPASPKVITGPARTLDQPAHYRHTHWEDKKRLEIKTQKPICTSSVPGNWWKRDAAGWQANYFFWNGNGPPCHPKEKEKQDESAERTLWILTGVSTIKNRRK